jgi:hypothetical protein
MLVPLFLAASTIVSGTAAEEHARRLAALGPHPWGSTLNAAAAQYVASQFRDAGLSEVRLQPFESNGIAGANVIGTLRAPGPELVVIGAHHDTVPDAPGAYDDGGGVGVLIETARVLAGRAQRPRTIMFASWDGEEAFSQTKAQTTGSRAFVKALGDQRQHLIGAVAIEMSGWSKGTPCLHPLAYPDPYRPGRYVIAPAWMVETALAAGKGGGGSTCLGDPQLSWIYQPAVRLFRARLYGDDLSFTQAGLPALMVSDSTFSSFYPWYHQRGDTGDKINAQALGKMGQLVLDVTDALSAAPRPANREPHWFAAGGRVFASKALYLAGALTLLPALVGAYLRGGIALYLRLAYSALFALLLWRHPVPTLWALAVPNLFFTLSRRWWTTLLSALPLAALLTAGAFAYWRGAVAGSWLQSWELGAALLALPLAWLQFQHSRGRRNAGKRNTGKRRRGLPRD